MAVSNKVMRVHPTDTVAVVLEEVRQGEVVQCGDHRITAAATIAPGHKIALVDIVAGADVIKYGAPIGHATAPIAAGAHVHLHNLATNLDGVRAYQYHPVAWEPPAAIDGTFEGYLRENGTVGIRNEIWIIPTVGCVNGVAERLAQRGSRVHAYGTIEGVFAFPHPYGCSQLGGDHRTTQRILAGLVNHPNAGGVLVLGLGCENNHLSEFLPCLGAFQGRRVKFLDCQQVGDEMAEGMALIDELALYARREERQPLPLSCLKIGVKCGGSDGLSGITANPLVGMLADRLVAAGGTVALTEVPEMFGAEHLLMNRCADRPVFEKLVAVVNEFKEYFTRCGQAIYENPSPGNKDGGISTLEEKSLGCVQKGGSSPITAVLNYGDGLMQSGLQVVSGPGNDIVSQTALVAAGAQLLLFTTGRGTPLGAPAPTLKIASNSEIARRKPNWIDFNAGALLDGHAMDELTDALMTAVLEVASGTRKTRNEIEDNRQIAIWKDGVTL